MSWIFSKHSGIDRRCPDRSLSDLADGHSGPYRWHQWHYRYLITTRPKGDSAWRFAFVLGLVSGPAVALFIGGLGNVVNAPGEVIGQPSGDVPLMFTSGLGNGIGERLH